MNRDNKERRRREFIEELNQALNRRSNKGQTNAQPDNRKGFYSDVNGSYTGRPIDGGMPVQDADDL